MLIDRLRGAGALVTEVEAYRMAARPAASIRAEWSAANPDAAIIASPSTAAAPVEAVGHDALAALRGIVAIAHTGDRARPGRAARVVSFDL